MTVLKAVGVVSTAAAAGAFVLLQSADANPGITGAVLLSATSLALLLYLLRRVQAIPTEEGKKRHDAMGQVTVILAATDARLSADLQRMEARLMTALTASDAREATERHRVEDRVRELEKWEPRHRRKGE